MMYQNCPGSFSSLDVLRVPKLVAYYGVILLEQKFSHCHISDSYSGGTLFEVMSLFSTGYCSKVFFFCFIYTAMVPTSANDYCILKVVCTHNELLHVWANRVAVIRDIKCTDTDISVGAGSVSLFEAIS
jgi:hypothetical protein